MEEQAQGGRPIYTNIELSETCPFQQTTALIDVPGYPVALKQRPKRSPVEGLPPYQFFWEYVMPGSLVVIDEVQCYFNSRCWGEMADAVEFFHTQHRKLDLDLIYITQRMGNVYNRIRDLAGRIILAEYNYRQARFFRLLDQWLGREASQGLSRFFYYEFSDPSMTPRYLSGEGYVTFKEASRFFSWYTTKQILGQMHCEIRPDWSKINGDAESGGAGKGKRGSRRSRR